MQGKCVCFKILFHAFSERQTGLSGAKCEGNTMSHCGRGGDRERERARRQCTEKGGNIILKHPLSPPNLPLHTDGVMGTTVII